MWPGPLHHLAECVAVAIPLGNDDEPRMHVAYRVAPPPAREHEGPSA